MGRLFIPAVILLSACQTSGPKNIDRGDMSLAGAVSGTVIHQSSRELENGFYDVSKSVVNSAGHWEGIGHFGYIYHNKTEICQCSDGQTVRSPNGEYIGYRETAEWDTKSKSAIIYFSAPNGTKNKELAISLH